MANKLISARALQIRTKLIFPFSKSLLLLSFILCREHDDLFSVYTDTFIFSSFLKFPFVLIPFLMF